MFKLWLTTLSCCAILTISFVLWGCQDTLVDTSVSEAPKLEQVLPAPETLKSSEDYLTAMAEIQWRTLTQARTALQTMEEDEKEKVFARLDKLFEDIPIAHHIDLNYSDSELDKRVTDTNATKDQQVMAAWMEDNELNLQKAMEPFVPLAYFEAMEILLTGLAEQLVEESTNGVIDTTGWRPILQSSYEEIFGNGLLGQGTCAPQDTQQVVEVQQASLVPSFLALSASPAFVQQECPSCCIECETCLDICWNADNGYVLSHAVHHTAQAGLCGIVTGVIGNVIGMAACVAYWIGINAYDAYVVIHRWNQCKEDCKNRTDCIMCGDDN